METQVIKRSVELNMELPIRWGVIGCGNVTEVKSTPAFQKVAGFEVVSVLGRTPSKIDDYIKRHGIDHGCTDYDEFIQKVDAVYIATPPDSHIEYAQKVLAHRKPCCIEKPITNKTQHAESLVSAYRDADVPLFVSYYRRSLPRFLKVKEWIDEEAIGEIRHISWQFTKPANQFDLNGTKNWRTEAGVARGGYFEDLASHGLDLFTYFLGDITKAKGVSLNQQGLYSASDSVSATWTHQGSITGSGYWNFGSYERQDKVEIIGSKGKITFAVFLEAPLTLATKDHKDSIEIENPENIQLHHAENIKNHFLGISQHPSTGASALKVNRVMDQILS